VIRYVSKFASQFAVPQMSEEASQLRQTHPGRSTQISLFSYQASGIEFNRNWLTLMQTLLQLCERWPLRDFFNFP
jgi:hypothetical protein